MSPIQPKQALTDIIDLEIYLVRNFAFGDSIGILLYRSDFTP